MNRLEAFQSLEKHPLLGKVFKRLIKEEIDMCDRFIRTSAKRTSDEFEYEANRLFLDVVKTRHYKEMLELLSCANTISKND